LLLSCPWIAAGERGSEADRPGGERDADVVCGAVSVEAPNDPIFGFAFSLPFGAEDLNKLVKGISPFFVTQIFVFQPKNVVETILIHQNVPNRPYLYTTYEAIYTSKY